MFLIYFLYCLVLVRGAAVKDNLKDEHCTDPRTMRKHAAYTEWADAYSCTRHRCQPGGRNLAIYTVGCKRVEAPESAIECEEVVEDTNMQFPYCCTRLRCLVVVRGEVWTRVLGQPWETLPAAPWSHMYKMKKPPPVDSSFLPKNGPAAGPVYELTDEKREPTDRRNNEKDCDKPVVRAQAAPAPDIIALTTNSEKKSNEPEIPSSKFLSQGVEEQNDRPNDIEAEETPPATEKVPEIVSEERIFNTEKKVARDRKFPHMMSEDEQPTYRGLKDGLHKAPADATSDEQYNSNKKLKNQKAADATSDEQYNSKIRQKKQKMNDAVSEERVYSNAEKKSTRGPKSWARIPQEQWNYNPTPRTQRLSENANDYDKDRESPPKVEPPLPVFHGDSEEKQEEKPASLQHLVNAIGTRMRDIENVVQQMSEKVQPPPDSAERMRETSRSMVHPKEKTEMEALKPKKPYPDNYNRFPPQQGGSKYIRSGADMSTEPPLFVGDNLNGYFSDPSNNLLRRAMKPNGPKEPSETYMAPINTDHKKPTATDSDEPEIKHKKHTHKKKKSKHSRKKHHNREEREKKKFTKIPAEFEKNVVSMEDSNDFGTETTEPLRAAPEKSWFHIRKRPSASYRPTNYRPTLRRPTPYPLMARYRPIATGRRQRLSHKQLMFLHSHSPLIKRMRNWRKYRHRI